MNAPGKSTSHILSSNTCDDCHTTVAWKPANVDHGSLTGSCSTCHNGVQATGKNNTHIQSNNTCDDCHTTVAWKPANFDHNSITGSCFTCHNGTTATGKSVTHITSGNTCDDCHTTVAWRPATFDHNAVTGSCNSCHNGSTATGKSAQHFITSRQCDDCHNNVAWTPVRYTHTSPNYPGDHRGNLRCIRCHTGNGEAATYTAPYKPDCGGCHAKNYKPGPHPKHENPGVKYTVSELRDCSGSCHVYSDSTLTTRIKTRNSRHRANDGNF
ncbi:MAG TPA: hypothetical protein ENI64_11245 [Gammaproteobacteria bacterium]|nr:hypothetical protein [Gammaproteobacteria bacterium]